MKPFSRFSAIQATAETFPTFFIKTESGPIDFFRSSARHRPWMKLFSQFSARRTTAGTFPPFFSNTERPVDFFPLFSKTQTFEAFFAIFSNTINRRNFFAARLSNEDPSISFFQEDRGLSEIIPSAARLHIVCFLLRAWNLFSDMSNYILDVILFFVGSPFFLAKRTSSAGICVTPHASKEFSLLSRSSRKEQRITAWILPCLS